MVIPVVTWGEFEAVDPELAAFAARRLLETPAYLATVQSDGRPRVHPVTPILGGGRLFVFMEPTSPKGRDLEARGWFALHNGGLDTHGTGGEIAMMGVGERVDDGESRRTAVGACSYEPADRYVLFELKVNEAASTEYGGTQPRRRRWRLETRGAAT